MIDNTTVNIYNDEVWWLIKSSTCEDAVTGIVENAENLTQPHTTPPVTAP